MREILFRGKRKDNGEWVEGFLRIRYFEELPHDRYVIQYETTGDEYKWTPKYMVAEIDPETVGQYTGLTDKNGKKIFEGDILEHKVQSDILINRGVVNWDSQNARWALQLNTMNPCFYMHNPEAVEIIGNIHDNPEFLK